MESKYKVKLNTLGLLWTQNLSGSKKQANSAIMSSALALCYKPNIYGNQAVWRQLKLCSLHNNHNSDMAWRYGEEPQTQTSRFLILFYCTP